MPLTEDATHPQAGTPECVVMWATDPDERVVAALGARPELSHALSPARRAPVIAAAVAAADAAGEIWNPRLDALASAGLFAANGPMGARARAETLVPWIVAAPTAEALLTLTEYCDWLFGPLLASHARVWSPALIDAVLAQFPLGAPGLIAQNPCLTAEGAAHLAARCVAGGAHDALPPALTRVPVRAWQVGFAALAPRLVDVSPATLDRVVREATTGRWWAREWLESAHGIPTDAWRAVVEAALRGWDAIAPMRDGAARARAMLHPATDLALCAVLWDGPSGRPDSERLEQRSLLLEIAKRSRSAALPAQIVRFLDEIAPMCAGDEHLAAAFASIPGASPGSLCGVAGARRSGPVLAALTGNPTARRDEVCADVVLRQRSLDVATIMLRDPHTHPAARLRALGRVLTARPQEALIFLESHDHELQVPASLLAPLFAHHDHEIRFAALRLGGAPWVVYDGPVGADTDPQPAAARPVESGVRSRTRRR